MSSVSGPLASGNFTGNPGYFRQNRHRKMRPGVSPAPRRWVMVGVFKEDMGMMRVQG